MELTLWHVGFGGKTPAQWKRRVLNASRNVLENLEFISVAGLCMHTPM